VTVAGGWVSKVNQFRLVLGALRSKEEHNGARGEDGPDVVIGERVEGTSPKAQAVQR
jgi:hypothetical protein